METEIKHSEFLDCKMLGEEGMGCAVAGCWAQVLINNAGDLKEPEKGIRIAEIRTQAKENGCLDTSVTKT